MTSLLDFIAHSGWPWAFALIRKVPFTMVALMFGLWQARSCRNALVNLSTNDLLKPKNLWPLAKSYFLLVIFGLAIIIDNPFHPEARTSVVQIVGGGLGSVALFFAWMSSSHTQRQLDDQSQQAGEQRLQAHDLKAKELWEDRLFTALELLAKVRDNQPDIESRVSGILLLESLARSGDAAQRGIVLDILCHYLRYNDAVVRHKTDDRPEDKPSHSEPKSGEPEQVSIGPESKGPKPAPESVSALVRSDSEICILALVRLSHLQELSGLNLRKVSFRGMDLKKAQWRDCHLEEADLSAADLSEAKLDGCFLDEAKLVATTANGSSFAGCFMRKADLSDFRAARANLAGARLDFARNHTQDLDELADRTFLRGADLTGASLVDAHLPGLDVSEATLTGTKFKNAYLDLANFLAATGFTQAQLASARSTDKARHDFAGQPSATAGPPPSENLDLPLAPTADELLTT